MGFRVSGSGFRVELAHRSIFLFNALTQIPWFQLSILQVLGSLRHKASPTRFDVRGPLIAGTHRKIWVEGLEGLGFRV